MGNKFHYKVKAAALLSSLIEALLKEELTPKKVAIIQSVCCFTKVQNFTVVQIIKLFLYFYITKHPDILKTGLKETKYSPPNF